jgi:hypothetical protein
MPSSLDIALHEFSARVAAKTCDGGHGVLGILTHPKFIRPGGSCRLSVACCRSIPLSFRPAKRSMWASSAASWAVCTRIRSTLFHRGVAGLATGPWRIRFIGHGLDTGYQRFVRQKLFEPVMD